MQRKLLGTNSVDFDATGQLLLTYSAFIKYLRKWEYNEAVPHLFVDFKKTYSSVRREFGVPIKLVRLMKRIVESG
jgi:hypothetical protein